MKEDYIDLDGRKIPIRVYELDNEGNLSAADAADEESSWPASVKHLAADDTGPDLPLEPQISAIGFEGLITPALVDRAAAVLIERPDVGLQVDLDVTDLDFLADLPPVQDLTVMLGLDLANVDALATHATSLKYLTLETGLRPLDVGVLAELQQLEQLYLRKMNRSLRCFEEALSALTQLQHLTLHSVTLKDPQVLRSIAGLRGLALKLGGNRDLTFLPSMRNLRFLEIWGTRLLRDISPLAACDQLQALDLEELPHVVLPDMSHAVSLTDVQLRSLPRLGGRLAGLAAAPRLRYLSVVECKLTVADVEALRGHPSLQGVWLPKFHRRAHDKERDPILGLPRPPTDRQLMRAAGVMGLPVHRGETYAS